MFPAVLFLLCWRRLWRMCGFGGLVRGLCGRLIRPVVGIGIDPGFFNVAPFRIHQPEVVFDADHVLLGELVQLVPAFLDVYKRQILFSVSLTSTSE